jgi:hypothetical protein
VVLTASGGVFTFGYGARGQLGHGRAANERWPRLVTTVRCVSRVCACVRACVCVSSCDAFYAPCPYLYYVFHVNSFLRASTLRPVLFRSHARSV